MMSKLLVLTFALATCRAATVTTPVLITDTTAMGTPDSSTPVDTQGPMVTDTSGSMMTSTSGPMANVTAPMANMTTIPEITTVVTTPGNISNETLPCQPSLAQIQAVFNYTNDPGFVELSENQQIVIYELLAAGEACKLEAFITPQTAQRIFLLLEDLPLKYVYMLVSFMARNLEAEGIVVPV